MINLLLFYISHLFKLIISLWLFFSGVEGLVACSLLQDQPCLMHCRVHAGRLAVWLRSPVADLPDCLLYHCQRALQESWPHPPAATPGFTAASRDSATPSAHRKESTNEGTLPWSWVIEKLVVLISLHIILVDNLKKL